MECSGPRKDLKPSNRMKHSIITAAIASAFVWTLADAQTASTTAPPASAASSARVPRMADGHPDLSGVWWRGADVGGRAAPGTPAAGGGRGAARGPAPVKDKSAKSAPRARYAKGARVRARNLNPTGHTRLPRYVRGKTGVIARDWGVFVFPDTNAHHAGTKRQHCYSVVFDARELWGKSANHRERLYIDLWEDYLEPIVSNPKRNPSKRKTVRRSGGR